MRTCSIIGCGFSLPQILQLQQFTISLNVESSLVSEENYVVLLVRINLSHHECHRIYPLVRMIRVDVVQNLQFVWVQFSLMQHLMNQSLWKFQSMTNLLDRMFWAVLKCYSDVFIISI